MLRYISILLLICPSFSTKAFPSLDELALKHGADKSSAWHGYTIPYAKNFDNLRHLPLTFLEIGTAGGHSARMWEDYFTHPETKIITLDIEQGCGNCVKGLPRTNFYQLNQANVKGLENLAKSIGQFDIIIDDGSHVSSDQITSFKTLFPFIKAGGVYVIEDLLFSYHPEHTNYDSYERVDNPKACNDSMILFLHTLIDDLNYSGARTGSAHIGKTYLQICWTKLNLNLAEVDKDLTYYQRYIDRIEFSGSICFIFKKS